MGAAGPAVAHAFNFLAPSAAVRFFALTRTLSRYAERVIGHDAVLGESARLRPRLFLALAQRHARERELLALGDIDARVMRDVEAIEADLVQVKAPAAAAWGGAIAAAGALTFVGAVEALIVAMAFAMAFWGAPRLAHGLTSSRAGDIVRKRAQLRALSAALERGRAEIQTLGAAPAVLAMVDEVSRSIEAKEAAMAGAGAFIVALTGCVWIAALLLVIFSAHAHGADTAALTAAVLASLALSEQTSALADVGARRQERATARARVDEIMAPAYPIPFAQAPQMPWNVTVRDFTALGDSGRPLRTGVSLVVNPGEIAMITGRSGGGKSTLLRVLLGQRAPYAGTVDIGGVAPEARSDLAALIAYVPQSPILLAGAVRENLQLGAPGAGDAAMWRALQCAGIGGVVEKAGGLDAEVNALGEGFSGGEARRLALARAFVSERPLLLLDEPTEGLDASAETIIADAVRTYVRERPGRLAILVTHRQALKDIANTCVDLDAGFGASVY
jgi:ATP-binding cassette subfamily C protein CydC